MKNKYSTLIKDLSDKELLFHLYATQFAILVISVILAFLLYGDLSFLHRFSVIKPWYLLTGIGAALIVVMIDIILMRVLPHSYYDDGGLNDKIFRGRSTLNIFFIAALVALSEEILFRGVIQTKTGLIIASLLFAAIHFRYLFNLFLFTNIVLLSFFIGFMFEWSGSLFVTFVMHFIIDLLLGLYIKFKRPVKEEQEGILHE
ncbi:MAG: type II CAAX endopeptidase family protein [Bacillota bacterium]|nr:type II CAAX endopeptidase family protein [Bacillota bacterium]